MIRFGEIEGIPEGTLFKGLPEAAKMGLIVNPFKGISSGTDLNGTHGADAIVLNGGYEMDRDYGDKIIYTGDGGNLPGSLDIVKDQTLEARNKALVESFEAQQPVRVIRGSKLESEFAPKEGCRYDGLYQISDVVRGKTTEGHVVYQFILEKLHDVIISETVERYPLRVLTYSERLVRDTKVSKSVKKLNKDCCQVCGLRLMVSDNGYYSEGAHVQPLGKPFDGPDIESNILCLCPNHHVQFDKHYFSVNPETFALIGIEGTLRTVPGHDISKKYLSYHYNRYIEFERMKKAL